MSKLSSDMIDLLSILMQMYGKDTEIGALVRKIMDDNMKEQADEQANKLD